MMYPSSWNFLGLTHSESKLDGAKFVVLPLPYDSTSSYRPGSRNGPQSVIDASRNVELFDIELQKEPYLKGVFTNGEIEPVRGNAAETIGRVCEVTREVTKSGKIPLLIGGEHTITVGATRAFPNSTFVVDLDAHADLRDSYLDDPICHASTMRRILEQGKEIAEVGVRSMSQEEHDFAEQKGIRIFYREAIREMSLAGLVRHLKELVEGRQVYLSIDVDVFDPSEAPGVSTPEPDGLSFYEVKEIVKGVCTSSEVVGVDVVEVTPVIGNPTTEFLAASILYKAIGYI